MLSIWPSIGRIKFWFRSCYVDSTMVRSRGQPKLKVRRHKAHIYLFLCRIGFKWLFLIIFSFARLFARSFVDLTIRCMRISLRNREFFWLVWNSLSFLYEILTWANLIEISPSWVKKFNKFFVQHFAEMFFVLVRIVLKIIL